VITVFSSTEEKIHEHINKTYRKERARGGGALIGLGLLSAPAQALTITYTFDSSVFGPSPATQTVNGVTATFSGINSANGLFNGFPTAGLALNVPSSVGNQFNISFNQDVTFLSYNVASAAGIFPAQTATFDLSNPNGAASTGNNLASVGSFNFSNQFSLNAGQTLTLNATLSFHPNTGTAFLNSITVQAVPWETDALPVVGSTILFGLGVWGKRKFAKPLQK
jgi:hypothetical protein